MARAAILALLLGNAFGAAAQQRATSEYELKAAFIFNFLKYVEWPTRSSGPLVVCLAGQNPFGSVFFDTLRGDVNGRRIEPVQILSPEPFCHVVFVPHTANRDAYLRAAAGPGSATLLIGESDDFIERGGTIKFVKDGTKLRFEINADAAQRAGLRISASLLRLRYVPEARQP